MGIQGIELLVGRLKAGDEIAFHSLFDHFYPSLCLFALKYVEDQHAAEDIVQDTFIKYWDKHIDFDHAYKIKSYLYLVTRNSCLNYLRDRKKLAKIQEGADVEADEKFLQYLMEEEAYRILYQAVEQLPPQMRLVIKHALMGLKNSEIAEKMELSEHAVQAYKKRAYKKLRESLNEQSLLVFLVSCILFQ
ncbi:RNA polymerase sigma-70 factor [Mangrovibacterium marinum]|uniref:RNA polymerase sigma-70 factor (ECF subfamily) n=1 Tax=Mangrovibacterium marinum TaxID=1639118 RepID=A0A2T5BXQ7_9BACT|nr:RNA polymerase sigma-70 factor [Mangrovibacterium marinum]PTN05931.1 RNA polymerase sigma-70 factor (ECF subfamily) [Mangrovibacterium marinum]